MYTFFYRGTSGIDIDLRRVDINQCPATDEAATAINIFGGTDKCKKETTNVSFFYGKKIYPHHLLMNSLVHVNIDRGEKIKKQEIPKIYDLFFLKND